MIVLRRPAHSSAYHKYRESRNFDSAQTPFVRGRVAVGSDREIPHLIGKATPLPLSKLGLTRIERLCMNGLRRQPLSLRISRTRNRPGEGGRLSRRQRKEDQGVLVGLGT